MRLPEKPGKAKLGGNKGTKRRRLVWGRASALRPEQSVWDGHVPCCAIGTRSASHVRSNREQSHNVMAHGGARAIDQEWLHEPCQSENKKY